MNGLYADGTVYCKIRLEPVTYVQNKKFDLNNNEYFLLLAAGKEVGTLIIVEWKRTSPKSIRQIQKLVQQGAINTTSLWKSL